MSDDYGRALWRPADDHNYSGPRFRAAEKVDTIVVHVSGGSAESAFNTFCRPEQAGVLSLPHRLRRHALAIRQRTGC